MKNKFWVAEVLLENTPFVSSMHPVATEDEAIALVVKLAKEQGSTESDDKIADEARADGRYSPRKHAEWSICWGEL